ncbi:histidine phosphatase family protein [Allohahella marinimesophila]|uniref:Histidine phosphatase family protein n=1 Tax=Allohahella marinimesophila TaxID=1054972 RepID=A0ABP7NEP2_9GAMM
MILIRFLCLSLLIVGSAHADNFSDTELWQQLKRGEAVALMRHALAPGFGDPDHFVIDDCSSQRNLSAAGRTQAKQIGAAFRKRGMDQAPVYSSQWCRCLDTARLLELGPVMPLPALNSFFNQPGQGKTQTAEIRRWLQSEGADVTPLVLVTHQVNITALTNIFPASGEMVILRRNGAAALSVSGTILIEP